MRVQIRTFTGVFVFVATAGFSQVQEVNISEPATVKLEELFKQADVVAVVTILSGDSEHYPITFYKTNVVTAFKGVRKGQNLYFGPYISYAIGGEYVAFLRKSKDSVGPSKTTEEGLHYGPIQTLHQVMCQGYSIMPVEYVCVFSGKEIREQCDYGVKVNTFQVKLPKKLATYPLEPDDDVTTDKKWIRKDALIAAIELLRSTQ